MTSIPLPEQVDDYIRYRLKSTDYSSKGAIVTIERFTSEQPDDFMFLAYAGPVEKQHLYGILISNQESALNDIVSDTIEVFGLSIVPLSCTPEEEKVFGTKISYRISKGAEYRERLIETNSHN